MPVNIGNVPPFFTVTASSITGLTAGQVPYGHTDGTIAQEAAFAYDAANDRLSVPNLAGGSSSGGDLTVNSTSHATKGKIYFGASAYFDEANTRLLSPTVVGSSSSAGDLSLLSTTHATKGKVYLGTTAYWDETNTRMVAARLAGGSGSAGDITINSTSHATKGKIYLGSSSGVVFDEPNNSVGIGAAPAAGLKLDVTGIVNSSTEFRLQGASYSRVAQLDNGGGWGGGYNFTIDGAQPEHDSLGTAAGIHFTSTGAKILTGASAAAGTSIAARLTVDTLGNVVCGSAALDTNATDGFFYAPSSAGSPSGTPTTFTGRVPLEVDTTNGRIYAYYGGAWHYAALT